MTAQDKLMKLAEIEAGVTVCRTYIGRRLVCYQLAPADYNFVIAQLKKALLELKQMEEIRR